MTQGVVRDSGSSATGGRETGEPPPWPPAPAVQEETAPPTEAAHQRVRHHGSGSRPGRQAALVHAPFPCQRLGWCVGCVSWCSCHMVGLLVYLSIGWFVCPFVCLLVYLSVGVSAGHSVGWFVCWSLCWLVCLLVTVLVGLSVHLLALVFL